MSTGQFIQVLETSVDVELCVVVYFTSKKESSENVTIDVVYQQRTALGMLTAAS